MKIVCNLPGQFMPIPVMNTDNTPVPQIGSHVLCRLKDDASMRTHEYNKMALVVVSVGFDFDEGMVVVKLDWS